MTKLISTKFTKGQYANQNISLPVVGVVTFDSEGNVEVPEDKVQEVLIATEDSFAFKVQPAPEKQPDASVDEVTPPPAIKSTPKLTKKQQRDIDNTNKEGLVNEVLGKSPVIEQQPVGEANGPEDTQLTEEQQQIKDELDQADLPILIELASAIPELADKELAGMTDVQLRQQLFQAMTKE